MNYEKKYLEFKEKSKNLRKLVREKQQAFEETCADYCGLYLGYEKLKLDYNALREKNGLPLVSGNDYCGYDNFKKVKSYIKRLKGEE